LHLPKLLDFGLRRKDYPLTKISDQLFLAIIAVDLQEQHAFGVGYIGMRANSVIVSSVVRLNGLLKSNRIGR